MPHAADPDRWPGWETTTMEHRPRRWCLLLLAAGLTCGCFGTSRDSYYLGRLWPGGDLVGGGPGPVGYAGGTDPRARRLEVVHADSANPVRTQQVVLATVSDDAGQPLPGRRVEWMIEGVGNIFEVDGEGPFTTRPGKVSNQYAVSYTGGTRRRVSRHNGNPNDDVPVAPGQTWCAISSTVEGDSHVTAYAPEVANWDSHKAFATTHWVDADWVLPRAAVHRVGTQHTFTTNVFRHSDHQPLANYRVRYRILDGPPATFPPGQAPEAVATTDPQGQAGATLGQVAPAVGANRVGVEILRPPDPSRPGDPLVIARGETTLEWQDARVVLTAQGPPSAAVGAEVPYTITVANGGKVESPFLTVHDPIPAGGSERR